MGKENTVTTIKLERKTKERIDRLKVYRRETYDEVLNNILNILNICRINPEQARLNLRKIDASRKERTSSELQKSKVSGQS